MKTHTLTYTITTFFLLTLHCGQTDLAGSGSQTTNSNCIGKIYNIDNTPAERALVRLIPADHNPSTSIAVIDSTYTTEDGSYTFAVTKSDIFNITAEKAGESCMLEAVPLNSDKVNTVENDTLEPSGFLSGRIIIEPGHDPLSPILLILGTTVYTSPYDSTGSFTTPALPPGTYSIRIFSIEAGYQSVDTSVAIASGDSTVINISLLYDENPIATIKKLSVELDSSMLMTDLTWVVSDTNRFQGYALIRKVRINANHTDRLANEIEKRFYRDTLYTLNKSATTFRDDVIRYTGDTIEYSLSLLDNAYLKRGTILSGKICPKSNLRFTEFLTIDNIFDIDAPYNYHLLSDESGNLVTVTPAFICKVDTSGMELARHDIPYNKQLSITSIQSDDSGNIYCLMIQEPSYSFKILKFNNALSDFREYDIKPLEGWCPVFAVNGKGQPIIITRTDTPSAEENTSINALTCTLKQIIYRFDTSFTLIDSNLTSTCNIITDIKRYGSTFFVCERITDNLNTIERIGYYDASFIPYAYQDSAFGIQNSLVTDVENYFSLSVFGRPDGLTANFVHNIARYDLSSSETYYHDDRIIFINNRQNTTVCRIPFSDVPVSFRLCSSDLIAASVHNLSLRIFKVSSPDLDILQYH